MWSLDCRIGDRHITATGPWLEMRERARAELVHIPGPERPTVAWLLAEAVPDAFWACSGADCSFMLARIGAELGDMRMSNPFEHSDRAHADLGASSCYRWWNCSGCINAVRKANSPKRTSVDAERGTAAHEVAHMCLLNGQEPIEYIDRVVNKITIDEKITDGVQMYVDLCRQFMADPEAECFTEKRFNLKKLKPPGPMFGTSDFGAVFRRLRKVVLIDYKNGFLPVDPMGSGAYQLKYYVLGVLCSLPEDVVIETIEVYIVQPNGRGPRVKKAEFKMIDIFTWHTELLKRAEATMDPNAPLTAGPWCKFCGIEGQCATQAEANMEAAQLEFTAEVPGGPVVAVHNPIEYRLLTPEQLGALLVRFEQVEDFIDAGREAAKALIEQGVPVPNWKMIGGLGHRKWINEDAAATTLQQYRLTPDQIWKRELISPVTVEKLLRPMLRELGIKGKQADEMLAQAIGALTMRPETAPRLVRDTDPNPALPARGEEFTAEPMPANP